MKIDLVSCFDGGGKHVVSLLTRFLMIYFKKMNVECRCVSWNELLSEKDWFKYEHLLSLDKAGFTKHDEQEKIKIVQSQVQGQLCAIEHLIFKRDRFVERIFYTIPRIEIKPHSYVGWAAEPEFCYPEEKEFILIDHPYYKLKKRWPDYSHVFKNSCSDLNLKALYINNEGISEVTHNNYCHSVFDRKKNLPWDYILTYYRRAKVFVVTHKEILGWSVIEAAMCGAVILMPKKAINPALIQDLPHVIVEDMNDFEEVKEKTLQAVTLSDRLKEEGYKEREYLAEKYTWKKVCERIVEELNG